MEGRPQAGPSRTPLAGEGVARVHRLPAVARSVGAARHWLAEQPLEGVSRRNAQLVLSELVTNSIVHAGLDPDRDEIEIRLHHTPTGVRVEVLDHGRGFADEDIDMPRRGPQIGGNGLAIVARLADRWGVDRAGGTRVWFEMDRR
jgi:anti-sigma regulatory factor (Ser/Thr protein kinase)